MEAALGDAFILDGPVVHRGGGRTQDILAIDRLSQVPNIRWVAFMHVAKCQLAKNVTEGIRSLFWASNPRLEKGDKVKTCLTKGCQKRAIEGCCSCNEVRLCLTHKMTICSKCDVPSSNVSVAAPVPKPEPESVTDPVSASAAAAPGPIAEVLPLDYPVQCFFAVRTITLSLAWTPKKPCLKKDPGSEECP